MLSSKNSTVSTARHRSDTVTQFQCRKFSHFVSLLTPAVPALNFELLLAWALEERRHPCTFSKTKDLQKKLVLGVAANIGRGPL